MKRLLLGLLLVTGYATLMGQDGCPEDADGDGFNACLDQALPSCDCDDDDDSVYPGASEVCDGQDNDCDGSLDEGAGSVWYADDDGDGYGDPDDSSVACSQPAGHVSDDNDCDDDDNTVYPGASERCDGKDNDCDGTLDEGFSTMVWYADDDEDGFGDPDHTIDACAQPEGYVSDHEDCDDSHATVNPDAEEVSGDGLDNNCDGYVDSWNRVYAWGESEYFYSGQQTSDGGFVAVGQIYSSAEEDAEALLVKASAGGSLEWSATFDGQEEGGLDKGQSVQQTDDGGYVIAGNYSLETAWLIKTDETGNEDWERIHSSGTARSVWQTTDGGYVVGGSTDVSTSTPAFWLLETYEDGSEDWQFTADDLGSDYGYDAQQTSDGGYIIAGVQSYSSSSGGAAWLIKVLANGQEDWNRTYGDRDRVAKSVQQTSDGGYIVAGYIYQASDAPDIWLLKTDEQGNEEWSTTFGGSGNDYGYSVQQTFDGGYIVLGGTESFGTGSRDAWLIKTDSEGNEEWSHTYGGGGWDIVQSVRQTQDGGYFITGWYSNGSMDGWMIKTDWGSVPC